MKIKRTANTIWTCDKDNLDNNVMILSAKFADIKVSNFLIETRLGAREYSNETIFLTTPSKQCGFCNYLLDYSLISHDCESG